jgi:hypothetical protein
MSKNKDIINWYDVIDKKYLTTSVNPNYDDYKEFTGHKIKFPSKMLLVGNSGAGKTQLLASIIKLFSDKTRNSKKMGTFRDIKIITRNKDNDPIYKYLADKSNQIQIYENDLSKIELDKYDKEDNHLLVFDDLVMEKNQTPICETFIRCRKQNCMAIYLSQSYYQTPKIIRTNCDYIALLKISGTREINSILRECSLGVDKKTLHKIYEYATKDKFYPLFIDMIAEPEKRFRKGIFEVIDVNDFV